MPDPKRICVWSGPRNVSTALLYSFGQRTDTRVFDEPLYGPYLVHTGAPQPGRDELILELETDAEKIIRETLLGPSDRPIVFYKSMAHHLEGLDWLFLKELTNVLLVRDPEQMLPSLANQLERPNLLDTGLEKQTRLLDYLEAEGLPAPPVLDSRELQTDPEGVLRQLCERVGIAWDPAMLRWPAGPKPYDGSWAKHWYHNVHRSTGFSAYRPKTEPFPDRLMPLLAQCKPHYERLRRLAIRAR